MSSLYCKGHRVEKRTPPLVVAVVMNFSYVYLCIGIDAGPEEEAMAHFKEMPFPRDFSFSASLILFFILNIRSLHIKCALKGQLLITFFLISL